MVKANIGVGIHATENELADLLAGAMGTADKERVTEHAASCDECLCAIVSSYESVCSFKKDRSVKIRKGNIMKKINLYLAGAMISFGLSFLMPRFFIQFLVATLLLGTKWIVDSKSTKMLIMIYEAWKRGGEKEASRILKNIDIGSKDRF